MDISFTLLYLVALILLLLVLWHGLRWLWKKGITGRIGAIAVLGITPLLLAPFLVFAVPAYEILFPPEIIVRNEASYRAEFLRLVGIQIPNDAQFLQKESSTPDFFGDYSACFSVQLNQPSIEPFIKLLGTETNIQAFEKKMPRCDNDAITIGSKTEMKYFDITPKATREEATIGVIVNPSVGQIFVSWNLW